MWWYEIDPDDTIVAVSSGWDAFALANDGADAVAAEVVGRRLWDFVAGAETRALLAAVLAAARQGTEVTVPMRCDSAGVERHLAFRASLMAGGRLRISTRLVQEQPREPVPWFQVHGSREPLLRMCGWCNSVDVDGEWRDAASAAAALRLFEMPAPPRLSHGICQSCEDAVMRQLA